MKVLLINEKDLNSRGNGTQTTHQVALAAQGWSTWNWLDACPTTENVDGHLPSGSYLASDRRGTQNVKLGLQPGDLVREYTSSFRGGQKQGRAVCEIYIFTGDRSESGRLPENANKIGKARWNWVTAPNAETAAAKAARKWLDARAERERRAADPIYAAEDAAADALAAAEKEGEALWGVAKKAERTRSLSCLGGASIGGATAVEIETATKAAEAFGGYLPRLEALRDEAERTAAVAKAHTAALKRAERKAAPAAATAAAAPTTAPAPAPVPVAAPVVVLAPVAVSITEVRERIARLERELAEARAVLAGLEAQAAAAYDAVQPDPRPQ